MSTFGAFQSSVLGMVSQSHALGVIGANIANVATSGFKRTDAHFETLLGRSFASQPGTPDLGGPLTSQSGLGGVAAKDYARVSLQGELAASGGDYDVAINGPGFFVFEDGPVGSGRRVYGRDGAFASRVGAPLTAQLSDGTTAAGTETYLVDGSGRYVLGWPAAGGSAAPAANAGGLGPIRMDPYAFITPFAPTSAVGLGLNLPALAAEGSREAYSIDVFDSAGRAQPIQLGFTKTGINAWALDAVGAPGDALTLGPAPLAPLSFDAMGRVAGGAPYAISVTHPGGASSAFSLDLSASTQVAGPLAPLSFARDGHEAGVLDTIAFDAAGTVLGTFTNGRTRPLYRLALADFANPDGLTALSGNVYAESEASGAPALGSAGDPGLGSLVAGALERSNVDLPREFTRMLVTQKAYNASATAFRTTDEMTTIARDLKR
jgi:flagellar hook protein FlgE